MTTHRDWFPLALHVLGLERGWYTAATPAEWEDGRHGLDLVRAEYIAIPLPRGEMVHVYATHPFLPPKPALSTPGSGTALAVSLAHVLDKMERFAVEGERSRPYLSEGWATLVPE